MNRIVSSVLTPRSPSNSSVSLQSSVQDWGEEVEDGAVYNVTLKRVQIQQAANKGARWLGVSLLPPPGPPRRLAAVLWRWNVLAAHVISCRTLL